jgi:hypothetical protein
MPSLPALKTTSFIASVAIGMLAVDIATRSRNLNVIRGVNGQLDQLNTEAARK